MRNSFRDLFDKLGYEKDFRYDWVIGQKEFKEVNNKGNDGKMFKEVVKEEKGT